MKTKIKDILSQFSQKSIRPDGSSYSLLQHRDETLIAGKTGLSAKDVQIAALQNDIVPERYSRNQKTLSNMDQIKLLQSHVVVVGQGGLGGTVTEILARIGIGNLTLVDGDVFEDSNLNRQLLSNVENLGEKKAEIGAQRTRAINPAVNVQAVTDFFSKDNGLKILNDADLAVDCLDSIPDRFLLEDASRKKNIPLVSAAIGGTSGQAMVIFPEDPGLCLIYGDRDAVPRKGIETQLGTLPFAAVYMAAIECAEVVSIICSQSSQLQNHFVISDVADLSLEKISLS